ncbi:MAG: zinc ribbon domain-containing protein [Halioglobus sp.]|nr:zinc ribbon domain-containing protein [Halioglobus sp.]
MPVYEFKCKKCGNRFELAESISQHDKHREKCPACGSRSLQNVVSSVSVKTSKKS